MPEGSAWLDISGRAPGRGAYICKDEACFSQAYRKRLLDRALKIKITDQGWYALEKAFSKTCPSDYSSVRERD
ncbi:MAG: YlxR family protein [Coriobacteriia bacterium]|nr:YlxR family protein [Coriobacteriia bacterium]